MLYRTCFNLQNIAALRTISAYEADDRIDSKEQNTDGIGEVEAVQEKKKRLGGLRVQI